MTLPASRLPAALLACAIAAGCAPRTTPATPQPQQQPRTAPAQQAQGSDTARAGAPGTGGGAARGPRPYTQVVTARAVTDSGGITVHRVADRFLFEVPDSLLQRDLLLVSRIAGVPANFGGFLSAGTSIDERVVRFERNGDRLLLRSISFEAVADDTLPIAQSVMVNNVGPILAAFPVAAYTRDSGAYVIDVTDFFSGDTPALSGLSAAQRRTYQVRRLDPARSFVNTVKSFPMNVEVRHTQTFEAAESPSDRTGGTISLVMRQSLVVLPKAPMRPRYADERAGFFTVERVNYGLDEQKAASQTFIRRWRLEPKDTAAYLRGELVEPVKPIVYYVDPATPAKWAPYVKQGVEDWQRVFEKAGFRNAIIARYAPTPAEDPDFDPEDIRYSSVRWAASLTRNAVGPSTSDPRTGEIIESDITWYHNHMRSYRNRLLIETGAANPAARTLDIPDELMGETMRQVIAHEIGHALGLPHNMIASSSFPVDSLRSRSFTNRYGVSATIMDYARQNYIAQPGDGLEPKDFIRRLGPWDEFIINWGYRVIPGAPTPEAERPVLDRWLASQTGPMGYRYLPQYLSSIDPRSQTEDLGNDPIGATRYALQNMQRMVPSLVSWTTSPGEDYGELREVYGEAVGMWRTYMNHVATIVGAMHVEPKTADQPGAVYAYVPRTRQQEAVAFLAANAFRTPEWLEPAEITSRIGPSGALENAQSSLLTGLLASAKLGRMSEAAEAAPGIAWAPGDYLATLRRALIDGATADANRRQLHRVFVDRLGALVNPPAPAAGGPGGGGGGGGGMQAPPSPLLVPVNLTRSDLPAIARAELRAVRSSAQQLAGAAAGGTMRAHWLDLADRVTDILDPRER